MSQLGLSDSTGTRSCTRSKNRARSVTWTPLRRHSSSGSQRQHATTLLADGDDDFADSEPCDHLLERFALRQDAVRRDGDLRRLLELKKAGDRHARRVHRRQATPRRRAHRRPFPARGSRCGRNVLASGGTTTCRTKSRPTNAIGMATPSVSQKPSPPAPDRQSGRREAPPSPRRRRFAPTCSPKDILWSRR